MKKIWRIRKQLMAACLVAVLVLSMIFVPTKKAYAIAGVDDAAFILAMLAAAGAGYVGYNCFNGGTNPQDDFNQRLGEIEDTLKDCYDKTIAYILTQGGGGGNPDDFDPDNDDPEKKLTTWEKLKQWWKKHPNASLSLMGNASVLAAVAPVFKKNIDEKATVGNADISSLNMPDFLSNWFSSNIAKYPYYVLMVNTHGIVRHLALCDESLIFVKSSFDGSTNFYANSNFVFFRNSFSNQYINTVDQFTSGVNLGAGVYGTVYTNVPYVIYDSKDEALKAFKGYASNLNPNSTLTTDAAKKAQEDEEKKDKPVYDNVVLPTEEQMNDYINKLNEIAQRTTDPAQRLQEQQKAMNAFVESITNVSPNPEPSPDPNPNPSPDPSPNPDPSPDPDPSPEPDPDGPATDEEAAQYTADLTTVFPFCIPFDLIRAFKVLSVQGEAPVYEMPLQIDYKSIHVDEHWSIDMSDFSSVIQILRVMETLGFIVGLILVTRKLIRG